MFLCCGKKRFGPLEGVFDGNGKYCYNDFEIIPNAGVMRMKRQIVWLMTDTTRYDMLGCYGFGEMRTPNLDALAREGVRFERAYSAQPVCGPARSTLFTGLFPHENGSWGNSMPLGQDVQTLGQRLSGHGIPCAFIGKWHLDGGDYFGYGICPPGWDPEYWYDMKCYNGRHLPVQYALQTNGYAVSDEMIAFFARHGFLLGVSLDGIALVHDAQRIDAAGQPTYERVRAALNRLKAAGVSFNVLCVVSEQAAAHAREVYEALAPYRYVQFIPCLDALDGQTQQLSSEAYLAFLQTTFDLYERDWRRGHPVSIRSFDNWLQMLLGMPPESCAMNGVCSLQYVVESDGSVYPCDFYALDEWRLGNLNETSLLRMARTDTAKRFVEVSRAVPEACRECRWYRLCRNGCRRERDPQTGLNRWCSVMQRFWTRNAERAAQMALDISCTL